ncbi:MAG: VOC family protein [Verrucomicrobiota bacterium]
MKTTHIYTVILCTLFWQPAMHAQEPEESRDSKIIAHHACLVVADYSKAIDWYQKTLGFEVIKEWEAPEVLSGAKLAYIQRDGFILEIVGDGKIANQLKPATTLPEDFATSGFRHICFTVDSVDVFLAATKVKTLGEPFDFPLLGVRLAFFQDPEGNALEIRSILKKNGEQGSGDNG